MMDPEKLIAEGLIFPASKARQSITKVEAQVHTNWTDGDDSIENMYSAGIQNELDILVFSEHTSVDSVDWYKEFVLQVRNLQKSPTKVFVGTEVRISDTKGSIAIANEVRSEADVILASVHRFPDHEGNPIEFTNMPENTDVLTMELNMMQEAIKGKGAHVIAHPFGMSLRRFGLSPSDEQWDTLIKSSIEYDVALEFNSKYHRNDFSILDRYIKSNCLITFGSDAHRITEVAECANQVAEYFKSI